MPLALIESWLCRAGGTAGLLVLAVMALGFLRSERRTKGREQGPGARFLRAPLLLAAMALFLAAGWLLWRPLPLALPPSLRLAALLVGGVLYFCGLALYLWGYLTLGAMFGAASGFGVRLYAHHRLVTGGPYAWVRHPMYLAVIVAGWGGLLLFRTWAMALFAPLMLGLVARARREERALAQEFGQAWERYARRVPGWIPRLGKAGPNGE